MGCAAEPKQATCGLTLPLGGGHRRLCPTRLHDGEFEQRVAEWFLRNPLAKVEVYTTICDDQTAPVLLKDGGDWVEYQDPHPVYVEAVRRQTRSTRRRSLARDQADGGEQE